jgi:hypothetical protein
MSAKKPNLAAIVEAAGSTRRAATPEPPPVSADAESPPSRAIRAKSRAATRQVAAHFPEEVAWQLRELAVARRTTVQALIGEALNDLFQKHGKPEIVPMERSRAS